MIERLQEAAHRIGYGVRDRIRGYSDADVENKKRLAFGQPTPADREVFRRDEAERWGLSMQAFREAPGSELSPPPLSILSFHDEMKRLAALTEQELDDRIKTDALNRLRDWGQLGELYP